VHAKRASLDAGFSLMELLVVITILALLATIVGVNVIGKVDTGKQSTAKAQIADFETALDMFRLDVGRYPSSQEGLGALVQKPSDAEGWAGPYLKEALPQDPWKHDYVYTSPGEHGDYDIVSYGQDGAQGGEKNNKDVVSWKGLDD
jgi:general secretion pathway protein G